MIKIRQDKSANYKAVFFNGKTIRMRLDNSKPILAPTNPEIEDVAINSKCFANCFVAGTMITAVDLAATQYEIPIENIKINQLVLSFDETKRWFTHSIVDNLYEKDYEGEIYVIETNNRIIKCTPEHPFLYDGRWIEAKDLEEGERFTKITKEHFSGKVYNFSVKDTHTYIAEGVVVHNCNYCYTSATKFGSNFENIIEKAHGAWGSLTEVERPFQIAIGGAGESTIHPDWVEFIKTTHALGIMPNYTTNAMHTTQEILQTTEDLCGGVAISYHPHIEKVFHKGIADYSQIKTRLNVHVILGDDESFKALQSIYDKYAEVLDYLVVLPYQAAGRGKPIDTKSVWVKAFDWISSVQSEKFAFGALFYNFLLENKVPLEMSIYEPEIYSGYRMMDDSFMTLRKSSYDLSPKIIKR